jgi:hypothetical protein
MVVFDNSVALQKRFEIIYDAVLKIVNTLPSRQPLPAVLQGEKILVGIGLGNVGSRDPIPWRIFDFVQPRKNHFFTIESLQKWSNGLACSKHRRNVNLVKVFQDQCVGEQLSLPETKFAQPRIISLVQIIDVPFGLGVAHKGQFHEFDVSGGRRCHSAARMDFMKLELNTPGLLFPAISFLLLPYTNRYLTLANLLRNLQRQWATEQDKRYLAQIRVLRRRVNLIRWMTSFVVLAMLCNVVCILAVFEGWDTVARPLFIAAMLSLVVSLAISLFEIQLSTDALNLQLGMIDESKT